MGLDMYLYKVTKPTNVKEGAILSTKDTQELERERVSFFKIYEDYPYCNTFLENSIPCTITEERFDLRKVLETICSKNNLPYCEKDVEGVSLFLIEPRGYHFSVKTGALRLNYELFIPQSEVNLYTIETTAKAIAIKLNEIAYQRKGLSDKGWEDMACENCEYTDDYEKVLKMVDGGLSEDFISEWIDGETVFHPWW